MMIGESLIVLFMFAYQMLMNIEVKATPEWGLPQEKNENMAGTPARENENMAGTPTIEKEYMAGTPAIEWLYGGDSHKFL